MSQGHDTRARYLAGCRCESCCEANRAYQRSYRAARRLEGRQTVRSKETMEHIQRLRDAGLEWRAIAKLSGAAENHIKVIAGGGHKRVTRRVADGIGMVRPDDYHKNNIVPRDAALALVEELSAAGVNRTAIARAFRYRHHNLNWRHRVSGVSQRNWRRLLLLAASVGLRDPQWVLDVVNS